MIKRKSIYQTIANTPIKNIKTPICHFNGDEEDVNETQVYSCCENGEVTHADLYVVLSHIRMLLAILLLIFIGKILFCRK